MKWMLWQMASSCGIHALSSAISSSPLSQSKPAFPFSVLDELKQLLDSNRVIMSSIVLRELVSKT
jgi:hypothetical protein